LDETYDLVRKKTLKRWPGVEVIEAPFETYRGTNRDAFEVTIIKNDG
jgi:hypothetical protein